jgi:hypothetical protein
MNMRVDSARHQDFSAQIDDFSPWKCFNGLFVAIFSIAAEPYSKNIGTLDGEGPDFGIFASSYPGVS